MSNTIVFSKTGTKNAAPTLTIGLAPGLRELSQKVLATDNENLVKAAKYCLALADFLESPTYAERRAKQKAATDASRVRRGIVAKKPRSKPL